MPRRLAEHKTHFRGLSWPDAKDHIVEIAAVMLWFNGLGTRRPAVLPESFQRNRSGTRAVPAFFEHCRANHSHLTSSALRGYHYAHDMLCNFADAILAEGDDLPRWLQEYFFAIAKDKQGWGQTKVRRGRPRNIAHHDYSIAVAVDHAAIIADFSPTRNPASSTESGCSIVAMALNHIGVSISETGVVAIFRKQSSGRVRSKPARSVCRSSRSSGGTVLQQSLAETIQARDDLLQKRNDLLQKKADALQKIRQIEMEITVLDRISEAHALVRYQLALETQVFDGAEETAP